MQTCVLMKLFSLHPRMTIYTHAHKYLHFQFQGMQTNFREAWTALK